MESGSRDGLMIEIVIGVDERGKTASYQAVLVALLALLAGVAPTGAEVPPLTAADRVLLAETFRLADELAEEIWPGWDRAPWDVLLVGAEHEYLLRAAGRPEGFESLDDGHLGPVWARARTVPPGLRATYPVLGGPPTVVIGRPEATGLDPTSWIAIALHEHFHQLQMAAPGYYGAVDALELAGDDRSGMWMLEFPFPYDDPEVGRWFEEFCAAVLAALEGEAPDAEVLTALAGLEAAVSPADFRYLRFQIWQEGVPRFVQYDAARVAAERFRPSPALRSLAGFRPFAEVAEEIRQGILEELRAPDLAERRRVSFYAAGAGLAMLLEGNDPEWRGRYLDEMFALQDYLTR